MSKVSHISEKYKAKKYSSAIYGQGKRLTSIIAVTSVVGVAFVLLTITHATSPVTSTEAEAGTISSAAQVISDSSASSIKAIKFGGAPSNGDGNGACTGFPDVSCTGVPNGTTLTDASLDGSASDVTYTNQKFTNAYGVITGSNITFTNCVFTGGATFRGGTGITVSHSEFIGDVYFSSAHTVMFTNNNVHDFGDGVDITSDSGSTVSNVTMRNNWIHHPIATYPDHSDGSQTRGVSTLIMQHNTIDMGTWYTDQGQNVLNSAVYYEDANGGNTGIDLSNNYLNGAGYTLYAPGGSGSIKNNTFGPDRHFGYVYPTVDSGFTQSGNVDYQGNPVTF